jgi:hypothetical protein
MGSLETAATIAAFEMTGETSAKLCVKMLWSGDIGGTDAPCLKTDNNAF